MKTPKPHTKLFKLTLLILSILFGLVTLIFIAFNIYFTTKESLETKNSKNITISYSDIKSEEVTLKEPTNSSELSILPEYYTQLTKVFGNFSSHELTTYLRYGEVLKSSSQTSISEGYRYLQGQDLNILIPQTYIDQYYIAKIAGISDKLAEILKNQTTNKSSVNINKDSYIYEELEKCIAQNVTKFLNQEDCKTQIQNIEKQDTIPTLNFLINSLVTTPPTQTNTYDIYVQNQQYLYQLTKKITVPETENIGDPFQGNIYIDLNPVHIQKINSILNFLDLFYSQTGITDPEIKGRTKALENSLHSLEQYTFGAPIPSDLATIFNTSFLDTSSGNKINVQLNQNISYLVKSINLTDGIKTFVAPVYTFSDITFNINDNNFNEDYDVPPTTQSKGTVRVPIFMYHQIAPVPEGQSRFRSGLYVDPYDFEVEMAYLVKKNYKSVTTEEYYKLLKTGKNPTQKTVMITFDDGIENQYLNAYPILKKYNLKGVFFVVAHKSSITLLQRKEMAQNGMSIDSHSSKHQDLTKVSDPTELSYEIASSKSALQATTGKQVYSFAYPGCGWNKETISYVSGAGYLLGMSCGNTIDNRPSNKLVLSRVHAFGDLKSFKKLLSGVH